MIWWSSDKSQGSSVPWTQTIFHIQLHLIYNEVLLRIKKSRPGVWCHEVMDSFFVLSALGQLDRFLMHLMSFLDNSCGKTAAGLGNRKKRLWTRSSGFNFEVCLI